MDREKKRGVVKGRTPAKGSAGKFILDDKRAASLFEKQIKDLSEQELRELLLINMYKLAMVRAQLEALTSIIIKNKLATFEEIWKETDDNFKNAV